MYLKRSDKPVFTRDHAGRTITRADLPPADTRRWVAGRKATVVAAVNGGLLTTAEACARYDLSEEELESWTKSLSKHGPMALRVTALQRYRSES
ncbi:CtrA inhibitor SciP [Pontivivens insulae]|uniref:DUF1153 domain-containing protein n=1 Tax=Pontivivens insulae TaxID=1639689 RepID=A0A2R8AB34_9RHOB|nr:DUF1153 domain-containing protein [Pontivivens insulae]RED11386.1 uncharacterized protein DUF1153 [Pontivivens insulae]SPF29441.1 hypothetical protein POI8812_01751 [Pontivivens insulae]